VFLAFGVAAFLIAVVGAAFVPRSWPDGLRRWAHPYLFVPLGMVLTVRMLRRETSEVPAAERFNPRPVTGASAVWFLVGAALLATTIPVFVGAFGLRWSGNETFSGTAMTLTLGGIVMTAAAEEIAFRGYAFWRLIRLLGFWPAQAIVAGLFIVSHLTLGGFALLPALVGTAAGSVLFGAVFARTRSLAAPIALHTGWNILQHLLLNPLDPTATPLRLRFPHAASPGEYASMLALVALVMVAGTAAVLRFRVKSA